MNRRGFIAATGIGALAAQTHISSRAAIKPVGDHWADLDKILSDEFGGNRPGCYAYASLRGEDLFSRGYGLADVENIVPVSEQTVFRIASLTKPITAVAVLTLVDGGFVDLEDEIGIHLNECPPIWRTIKIHQLLSHTSGISGDISRLFSRLTEDLTPNELIDLYSDLPLVGEPGSIWTYSNANYWLLGLLIEAISGKSFGEYLDSQVFKKAGLKATRYGAWSPIIPHRAHGYSRSDSGETINARYFSRTLGYAAGGIVSTPRDLAKLCIAVGDKQIVSKDSVNAMMVSARTTNGEATPYGLGWFIDGKDDDFRAHHGGTSPGFVSYLIWRPSTGAVAALFSNNGALSEPKTLTEWIFRLLG